MNTVDAASAPMVRILVGHDLTREGQIDEVTFHKAMWESVRGNDSLMPAPGHGLLGARAGD